MKKQTVLATIYNDIYIDILWFLATIYTDICINIRYV